MRYVDKDYLLRDLSMIRYMLDDNDEPSIKFSDKQIKAICKYIERYKENECIECNVDYWLRYYDILTKEWKFEDENIPSVYSFRIVKKDLFETNINSDENKDDSTEEDVE